MNREPLQWTTAQWLNKGRAKVLAHKGTYAQFTYGTHTPSTWPRTDLQLAIICSPASGVIAIDVDDPALFLSSRTALCVSRANASTLRADRFHILVDAREFPVSAWPRQGPVGNGSASWGDIKANGFVAAPGSVHHSGDLYLPTGLGPVTATPALMEALRDDRASYAPPAVAGSGQGGGHDCQMMTALMDWLLDGHDKESARELWDAKAAKEQDPGWPYGDLDFERHYKSASRYAGEIEWKQEQEQRWMEAILDRVARP